MRFAGFSHKRDEINGLRTRKQIELFRQREAARREQAERREVEARVRHLNFELVLRIVLLVLAVAIAASAIIGAMSNPALLKFAVAASGAWGVIAAAALRYLRPQTGGGLD